MSQMPDIKDLRRLIRRLGIELRSSQDRVTPQDFIVALHERYDGLLTPEQIRYGFDQHAWAVGRQAMKTVEAEAENMVEARQLNLPMSLSHVKVPKALPIEVRGEAVTVTAVSCNIEEGDLYTESLRGNAEACFKSLTEWLSVWEPAKKVMQANPGWDFGTACQYLADHEGEAD